MKNVTKGGIKMLTKELETVGRVTRTHTHTQVISRNRLDRSFCAQKTNILDNRKLVM